jgi:acyl-CoA synthetase
VLAERRRAVPHADAAEPLAVTADGGNAPRTLAAVVRRHATERPDGIAFVEAGSGTTMTWADYHATSDRIAAGLVAQGHERGARLAVQLPDGPLVHAVFVGAEKAGVVVVGIGPRAGEREVDHLVTRTGAGALLREEELAAVLRLGQHAEPAPPERAFGDDELWLLNSTSGTTGLPKCVMHHQRRWFAFHEMAMQSSPFDERDVFCSALPAPFGFGLWTGHFTPALAGAPCVIFERFTPEGCLEALARHGVTVLAAVSTQFIMMLNSPVLDRVDLSRLRILYTGGEMIPYDRALEWEERTGSTVLQFYGSNETGALSRTALTDDRELRLRTAGRVIPEMHVRLYDEAGHDVTAGGGPAIPACKGPTECLGYWDDPAANAQLYTKDGWMLMADLGTLDADGVLTVVGRASDIIIRGGKNISAPKVEEEVATHPAVALVAAVAMPDPTFGERVCAFVVLRAGADLTLDALCAHLDARGVGKEYWPERLEVVDGDLPRSSGGKVAKGQLRELLRAERG